MAYSLNGLPNDLLTSGVINERRLKVEIGVDTNTIEKLDEVSTTLSFYGKALGGTLETEPKWDIQKTTIDGTITTRENFFNVAWSDRTLL